MADHRYLLAGALMMLPGVAWAEPGVVEDAAVPIIVGVLVALHLVCLLVPLGVAWRVFRGEGVRWKRTAATLIGSGGLIALGWLTSLFPSVVLFLVIALSGRTM